MEQDYKKEFQAKFEEILPEILKFEPIRKRYKQKYLCYIIPCIVVWLLIVLIDLLCITMEIILHNTPKGLEGLTAPTIIIGTPLIILIPILIFALHKNKLDSYLYEFKKLLKNNFMDELINVFGNIKYEHEANEQN